MTAEFEKTAMKVKRSSSRNGLEEDLKVFDCELMDELPTFRVIEATARKGTYM